MLLTTILITWMDDDRYPARTFSDVNTSIREGVLHIHQYTTSSNKLIREWHFPLNNIRGWEPVTNDVH